MLASLEKTPRAEIIRRFSADRALAHRVLFADRHPDTSCPAHDEMVTELHGAYPYVQIWAFRGFAKSTYSEEVIALAALLREFNNGLIIGSSEKRAQERLESIRHEMESNEYLHEVFGNPRGHVWAYDRLILSNGVIIQALGRGQKMRGTKHIVHRPNFVLLDDIDEDEESRDPDVSNKTSNWFWNVLLPALDANHRVRKLATPRDVDGLPNRLKNSSEFITKVYPIETYGFEGERIPQWPERFPLAKIDKIKAMYERQGKAAAYKQEYMCEIDMGFKRAFVASQVKIEPIVRTWQATYISIDPARTVNTATSATTGYAAFSWLGSRLVVWKAKASFDQPSQILETAFDWDETFKPVFLGIEKTGLSEWLLQPFRTEMAKRQHALPLRPLEPPLKQSKIDFILGLQPYVNAGDLVLTEPMPDLIAQMESFPSGRVDIPNALAYALRMRPGLPVYEDFSNSCVVERPVLNTSKPIWLAANAERGMVSGALCQFQEGRLIVFADWMREGEPAIIAEDLLFDMGLEAQGKIRVVIPPPHFETSNNLGLVQSMRRLKADIYQGMPLDWGRDNMRKLMQKQLRGSAALQVKADARWVLNGLSGGYCRAPSKRGGLEQWAEENLYRTMIEGVESLVALGSRTPDEIEGHERNYSVGRDGKPYLSALRRPSQ